jgi:hypothetical protein
MTEHPPVDLILRLRAFADLRRETGYDSSSSSSSNSNKNQKYFDWLRQELFRLTFISLQRDDKQGPQAHSDNGTSVGKGSERISPLSDIQYSVGFLSDINPTPVVRDIHSFLVDKLLKIVAKTEDNLNLNDFLEKTTDDLNGLISEFRLRSDVPGLISADPSTRNGRAWFLAPLVVDSLCEPDQLDSVQRHREMIRLLLRIAASREKVDFFEDVRWLSAEGNPRITWTLVVERTVKEYILRKKKLTESGYKHVPRPAEIMTVAVWEKDQPRMVDRTTGEMQIISDDFNFLQSLGSELSVDTEIPSAFIVGEEQTQ